MDPFNVPKKINRHVLKAVKFLSDGKLKRSITTTAIVNQVRYQMRNLKPVPNIEMAVESSLRNLSGIGLIELVGPQRYTHRYAALPTNSSSSSPIRSLYKANSRKRSRSELNPNINRSYQSDESLSGDEIDRTRKRLRTNNKPINHSGRSADLPKVRQHNRQHDANDYALDNPLSPPGISGGGSVLNAVVESVNNFNLEIIENHCSKFNNNITNSSAPIPHDNTNNNSVKQPESVNNFNLEIIENHNSKFNKNITNSSAPIPHDNTNNNSVKQPSETVNSSSVTAEKSNLIIDSNSKNSNLFINPQIENEILKMSQILPDNVTNNNAKSSSVAVNSPSVAAENPNLVVDSKSKNSNIFNNLQKGDDNSAKTTSETEATKIDSKFMKS